MTPLRRALGWLALASLGVLSACASPQGSSGSSDVSTPARVIFIDYRQGASFELVNEAHTDRVALYSEIRESSATKVASNEVMTALLEYLDSSGFNEHANTGVAPRSSSVFQWGGEIETSSGTISMLVNDNTPTDQRKMFIGCYMNHVQLWSDIFQLQRVDTAPGDVFKKPGVNR